MALLFIAILSTTSIKINGQVTPPLTGWTPTTAPSQSVLPEATSGLVAGYDSITRRIWLLGGFGAGENNIWYYSLEDDTFTDTTNTLPHALGVASVSAQRYIQYTFWILNSLVTCVVILC